MNGTPPATAVRPCALRAQGLPSQWRLGVLLCGGLLLVAGAASGQTSDFGDYSLFSNASSVVNSKIKIGATTDAESSATTNATATGDDITGIDDEDGVTLPASIALGASGTMIVNVTNTSGATTYLNAWIDYNRNGSANAGEQVASNVIVANGTSNANRTINFTVPATATLGTAGVRVRLTSNSSPGIDGADGNGEVEDYIIALVCPTLTISPSSLPAAVAGTAYSQTISTSGGLTPYSYAVVSGTLPAGLSLGSGTGTISGTPTTANGLGTEITIRATDAKGCQATRSYLLQVCPAMAVNPVDLPMFVVGAPYSTTVSVSGGAAPHLFGIASGALPAGFALNAATGVISGTPASSDTATFSVSVTDANGCAVTRAYTLQVCPAITVSPSTLPDGTLGTAYSETVSATGGTAPYVFAVTSGSLPEGLSLNTGTGVISGTPASTDSFTFTIGVVDARSCEASRSYTVTPGPNTDFGDYEMFPTASSTVNSKLRIGATVDAELMPMVDADATGDDLHGINDEDGVTLPATITQGASGTMTVRVTNQIGATTFLNVWIDFNGNGVLTDPGEQIATNTTVSGTNGTNRNINFTVPVEVAAGPVGVRVRLTSVSSPGPGGAAGIGEVEDHMVTIVAARDYGDYSGFASASSTANSNLRIGATVDAEGSAMTDATATGDDLHGTDDEDGVTLPETIALGTADSITVNVTNSTGSDGFLNAWIDFNRNGVLTDAGEQTATSIKIPKNTVNSDVIIPFNVPLNASLGTAGVRVRFTSVQSPGSTGFAGIGEVEDNIVTITLPTTDFGDYSGFADAFSTVHPDLRLGATMDTEGTATRNSDATGDDITGIDDEDAVVFPSMTAGQPVSLPVAVTNMTGAPAYLNAWIDYNNNGVLTADEQIGVDVVIPHGTLDSSAILEFVVPPNAVTAATKLGARFRLTTTPSPGPTGGIGTTGEVEDYATPILAPLTDFGDFSGAPMVSNTASSTLRLGATVDTEYSATLNDTATGDDITGIDDEDGVILPAMTAGAPATIQVLVTNSSGSTGFLNAWIDYNSNGVFTDPGEQIVANSTVANGTTNATRNINITVPPNAVTGVNLGARFRITKDISPGSAGAGGLGEVEDYVVNIAAPVTDFGDYSLFGLASSIASTNLRLGALVDTEYVATTNSGASGDDNTGVDDEDGIDLPGLTAGAPATIPVIVTNLRGMPAYLNLWIDFNGNGALTDTGEHVVQNVLVAEGLEESTMELAVTVPASSLTGVNLGVRMRLTSTLSPGPTGASGIGEVEDYIINVTAPTTDFGDFVGFADASQGVSPMLRLGATVDAEYSSTRDATATGDDLTEIDDEDGVTLPPMTAGQTVIIPVVATNNTGAQGFLNAWIDYNNNGVLTAGEQISANLIIPTGTNNGTFNLVAAVPATAVTGTTIGARFRLSAPTSPGPTGANASVGEIEDYVVSIAAPTTDFGDYSKFGGASSIRDTALHMGALVDAEFSATTNVTATGDDITGADDEDGVIVPELFSGLSATIPVVVTNTRGSTAYLNAWIDYNNNGVLTADEQIASNVSIANGSSNVTRNLNFTVPATAVTGVSIGVRVRLTSTASPGSIGASGIGEVEDYVTTIAAPTMDFGDWSGAAEASNGVNSNLRMGALVDTDAEFFATTNAMATGDDDAGDDDEDGVALPAMTAGGTYTVPVIVTNTTGVTAYLNAWIDFNNNGIFGEPGEQIIPNVPMVSGLDGVTVNRSVTVPANAVTGVFLGVRFRITSGSNPGPTGSAGGTGEVEDYVVNISAPTTDFGDFSKFGSASSTATDALRLGALVDTEFAATTNTTATGDDTTGVDDEDGVTLPPLIAGAPATIPVVVTNTRGSTAFLNMWIDYDNNGSLTDEGEQIATNIVIANGSTNLTRNIDIAVPPTAVTGVNLGVRVRLTSTSSPGLTGFSGEGEVEDYVVNIALPPLDYGDWSGVADASSNRVDGLRMGAAIDTEFVATRNATATGDDNTGVDDEDGVTIPEMTAGAPATMVVVVTNTTGSPAYLNAWIDFNNNNSLTDSGEQIAVNISVPNGSNGVSNSINFTVPANAATGASIGARFRLTSIASPGVTGLAGNGEVEDYTTTIAVPLTDFGDWSGAADASSLASSDLRMGALADTEYVSTRNATATGDDITASADEDGVTLSVLIAGTSGSVTVNVTNNTGAPGYLNAWIDFNGNGDFSDAGEQISVDQSIATGTNGGTQTLNFQVPAGALPGQRGARFRLTDVQTPGPVGASGIGEVEDYLITVNCPAISVSPLSFPNGIVGTPYSQTVSASGSMTAYTCSISAGALPAGLALNATTGVISGTPTSSATATFTVRATDQNNCQATRSYSMTPVCPTVTVAPLVLPVGTVGTAYSQTISASGATSPYTFAVTAGTLPAGLSLNATTGIISGTPTTANGGGISITLRATDAYGCVGTRSYTVQICPVITVSPTSIPAATVGTPYSQTVTASGGVAPYVYSIASGIVPDGLTLDAGTGVVSGTPTTGNGPGAGITFRATDANGCQATRVLNLKVCPVIAISPETAPPAYLTHPYSATLSAGNGAAPYTWSIVSGTLPPGLSMSSAGVISGTPATLTTALVTVSAVDANGCPGSVQISITVKGLTLGDLVWQDSNQNGLLDPDETGVAGALVQLFNPRNDNAIGGTGGAADVQIGADIVTTANGSYNFTGLPPGNYFVKVTPPAGFIHTSGTPSTTDDDIDGNNDGAQPGGANAPLFSPIITLAPGAESTADGDNDADTNLTVDFGLWSPLSVGNYVFQDINGDGNLDVNEGIPFVLLYIYRAGATPGITTPAGAAFTDYKGSYLITGLDSGNYFLHVPASQFGPGMPLKDLVPMATVVPGDDNAGQDLIFTNNPAVNGASTGVFALNFGEAPIGLAESGLDGFFDDDNDAAVDLTRDLGLVAADGSGFPLALRYRRTVEADAEITPAVVAPATFAQWQQMGNAGGAQDNPDADQLSNLMEYALGTDPASGLSGIEAFRVEANPATGAVDVVYSRPTEGRADLIYSVEGSADLQNWIRLPQPATATYASDGTQLRRIPNVDSAGIFAGSVRGFVRLSAVLDADMDGVADAVAHTPAYGFSLESFPAGTRSFSMPLMRPEIFGGHISGVGQDTIVLVGASGLAAKVDPPAAYYLEVLDGLHAGHRFDLAAITDAAVAVAIGSPQNTLAAPPADLAGARIVIRPHWTLGDLLPADLFTSGADADDADRVMFYDRATNTFEVNHVTEAGWRFGDVDGVGSLRIITPVDAALVHVRHNDTAVRHVGQVYANPLVAPQGSGAHFLGTGSVLPQPLPIRADFASGITPEASTRVRIWTADTYPQGSGYMSYFLWTSDSGPRWFQEAEPVMAVPTAEPPLHPFRGFFLSTPNSVGPWNW